MSKLKLNFATRVVALVSPKYQGDSGRSGEKQELKNAKARHKLSIKR